MNAQTFKTPYGVKTVLVRKEPNGERMLVIFNGDKVITGPAVEVPVCLAALAHGKDAWIRKVLVRCAECGEMVPCGEFECSDLCSDCFNQFSEREAE